MADRHVPAWAVALVLLLPVSAGATQGSRPIERSDVAVDQPLALPLARGSTLEVRGVNGQIAITRATAEETMVSAARDAGAAEPRIEMVRHDRGITICAVHASPNPKKPNECLPGKGRLLEGIKRNSPSVRFRVEVPDGVHFVGLLAHGDITSNAGASDVSVKTSIGNISITDGGSGTIQGSVELSGNLTALISAHKNPDERRVRLSIAGGELRVTIPTTLPIHYTISSDYPITTPFKLEKPLGTIRTGQLGPAGAPAMFLDLTTFSLLGKLFLLPRSGAR